MNTQTINSEKLAGIYKVKKVQKKITNSQVQEIESSFGVLTLTKQGNVFMTKNDSECEFTYHGTFKLLDHDLILMNIENSSERSAVGKEIARKIVAFTGDQLVLHSVGVISGENYVVEWSRLS